MLRLTDVVKSYGRHVAVDGLTLSVERGEIFGFLGPNGAGKTTTISLAVGLLSPDAGTVEIGDGGSPEAPSVRARVGVAPQALSIYEDLTARENLAFFGSLYGVGGQRLARRTDELLALVGLSDRAGDRAKTYSGGMQRRLNLAASLVHDPPLLLLDEPTAGVDPQSRNAIFDVVRALRDEGRTVVYTTHYMEEAERLCDRVAVIDGGRLLALDTVRGLLAAHGGPSTVVVERNGAEERVESTEPMRELARLLAQGPADAVQVERPTLESVFLSLTGRSLRD